MSDHIEAEFEEARVLLKDVEDSVLDFGAGPQVVWEGRVLAATFQSKGAAKAYLAGLRRGRNPT